MLRHLTLLLPASVFAAEPASAGISAGTYLQAALALLLIIALLGATAWLARKVSGGKGFGQGGMKLIGGVALGPRERIVLIEIGNDWLVVGIVPGQIRTLHRLEKRGPPEAEDPPASGTPFSQWLHDMTTRGRHD